MHKHRCNSCPDLCFKNKHMFEKYNVLWAPEKEYQILAKREPWLVLIRSFLLGMRTGCKAPSNTRFSSPHLSTWAWCNLWLGCYGVGNSTNSGKEPSCSGLRLSRGYHGLCIHREPEAQLWKSLGQNIKWWDTIYREKTTLRRRELQWWSNNSLKQLLGQTALWVTELPDEIISILFF